MNRSIVFRVVLALVVTAVLVAAGFALFNAGVAYGVAQSPEWARLAEEGARPGGMGQWMMRGGPGWGFGPHLGWGWRPFGGFGFLSCLVPVLFFFLVLALLRGVFGWRHWGWQGGGPGGWEQRGREKFDEWHKQAHSSGGEPAPSAGSGQQSSQ